MHTGDITSRASLVYLSLHAPNTVNRSHDTLPSGCAISMCHVKVAMAVTCLSSQALVLVDLEAGFTRRQLDSLNKYVTRITCPLWPITAMTAHCVCHRPLYDSIEHS